MFKIDDFVSSINRDGVVKSNRYVVDFTLPEYLRGEADVYEQKKKLSLRCENVTMPGMSFMSLNSLPRFGYGAPETIPYGVTFDDFTCSFLLDTKSDIHKFFYNWTQSIVNYKARGQSTFRSSGPANMAVYEVGYKDKYVSDITITVFDTTDVKLFTLKAYRCYPKSLPQIPLGWASNDELVKLNIEFSCTDFEFQYGKTGGDLNLVSKLFK